MCSTLYSFFKNVWSVLPLTLIYIYVKWSVLIWLLAMTGALYVTTHRQQQFFLNFHSAYWELNADKSWLMLIDAGDSKMWPMTREYSRQVAKAKSISGPKTRKSTHRRASLSALLFCCHICIIVTRLCNLHCHCIALDCHIQLVLGWYHHQPESHQLSLHKWRIDRTPGIPGSD